MRGLFAQFPPLMQHWKRSDAGGHMKLTRKLKASYDLIRSFLVESKEDYQTALIYSERAFRGGPSTAFMKARHAKLLMLNHRGAEASPIFQDLAAAPPSTNPQDEYIRVYSGLVSAYLKFDLVEADRLFAELQTIDCRPGRRSHFPWSEPPSVVRARSILTELDLGDADPLGFLDEASGLHVLNALEAWVENDAAKALTALAEAERTRPLTLQQQVLKAAVLIHAGEDEAGDQAFGEVLDALPKALTDELAYLRFYCEYFRPGHSANRAAALIAARELEPKAAVARILPMPNDSDEQLNPDAIRDHFRRDRWAFPVQRVEYLFRGDGGNS